MGFQVTADERLGIARVEYHGHATRADRAASMDALAPLLICKGLQRVLVDFSAAVLVDALPDGALEDPDAGGMQVPGGRKVAIVGLGPEEARVLETAGRLRRFDVRAFPGLDEAVRWLMH